MDFTVTQKGLEEQLLGRVIGKEQKALEEQLSDVLEEVNSNTKVHVVQVCSFMSHQEQPKRLRLLLLLRQVKLLMSSTTHLDEKPVFTYLLEGHYLQYQARPRTMLRVFSFPLGYSSIPVPIPYFSSSFLVSSQDRLGSTRGL